jgi:hypothetical protein
MSPRPVKIFFSYAHKDAALRNDLARHLARLERERVITTWSDQEIRAGDEWRVDIDRRLTGARVILLLVSEHFLASGRPATPDAVGDDPDVERRAKQELAALR